MAATIQWHYVEAMQRQGVQASLDSGTARLESADDAPFAICDTSDAAFWTAASTCRAGYSRSAPTARQRSIRSEAAVKFLDFYSTDELEPMARKSGEDPAAVVSVD